MANVEDEQTPGAKGAAGSLDRAERGDRGGLKALPREDDEQIDPEEYAQLLDSYDSSFRNIAEGEVVKGTVLKVTDTEVVVDVGFKSEGIIAVGEFLDEIEQIAPVAVGHGAQSEACVGGQRQRPSCMAFGPGQELVEGRVVQAAEHHE